MDSPDQADRGVGRFRHDPDSSLRPFVVEYWAIARDLAAMGGFTITPDRFGELIVCADDLYVIGERGREKLPTCFLVGLLGEPLRIEASGVVRCMAARLRTWSVGRFFEASEGLAARGWEEAGRVFGPRLAEVVEGVGRRDWASLVDVFDRALIEEVGRWKTDRIGLDPAGLLLDDGRPSTATLAVAWETSSRQVERRVRKLTGTSPKRIACLSRFQTARDAIWADPSVDLSRLAFQAGYSDQPHMTREFRRYAGQTPARFARDSLARKRWMAAQDVAIVQDRAEPRG